MEFYFNSVWLVSSILVNALVFRFGPCLFPTVGCHFCCHLVSRLSSLVILFVVGMTCKTGAFSYIHFYFTTIVLFVPNLSSDCSVGWGGRIHRLNLCRGVRPLTNGCPDMTLNDLMMKIPWCWGLGECRAHLYCHYSRVHSDPAW